MYIGQELPELTPVEIVGCEVCEAGSPLALDGGWFTMNFNRLEKMKKPELLRERQWAEVLERGEKLSRL